MVVADPIASLVSGFRLGVGHDDQERVVAAALRRLLVNGQRGVVLADEVGFGKTYEALAVVAHLCADARRRRRPITRVLVLCKPALVRKWEEETSSTHVERGFPRYLPDTHAASWLFQAESIRCIDSKAEARGLRRAGVRGQREDGKNQVPPGLYILNEKLLLAERRQASPLLRQIWRSHWDVVIVDEAHHYAHGNRPVELFAPDGDLTNYDQAGLDFDKILALTATPFELAPHELVSLLALVRADRRTLDTIETGLKNFEQALNRFFALRERSPADPIRLQQVALLERLRDRDALKGDATDAGLQALMRRFLIRNTKKQNERRYFLLERVEPSFTPRRFEKLDENLHELIRRSPLVPFEGQHTLFYLELRDLIQEVTELAQDGDEGRTFIPTDLRQGLSSYRQIAGAKVLERNIESAQRLKALVERWNRQGLLHPKVTALAETIREILDTEVQKLRDDPASWFSKILVFNKLIRGTAPQLKEVLEAVIEPRLDAYLKEILIPVALGREALAKKVRQAVEQQLDEADRVLKATPAYAAWRLVPLEFEDESLARFRDKPLLQVFREPLRRRGAQALALIDLARNATALDDAGIGRWVEQHLTGPVILSVRTIITRYLDDTPREDVTRETLLERAERELLVELEEAKSVDVIGRFDGENARDREAHRRNFNRRHNPFVLLVGQVGEEGIDLQEQCRYVIHYDLEWNPARMEQREGRVDRMGWGRAAEGFIDVRFLLLKGTYEERIFHTVMQRDQWFQVLIGSKRKELGQIPDDAEDEVDQDRINEREAGGALTDAEKRRVMLDLRPEGAAL